MIRLIKKVIRKYFIVNKITPIKTPVYEGNLLLDKTALIVGGSGGIGSAMAERFVANGCNVVVTGTNEEKLKALCEKIGSKCKYVILDLKSPETFDEKLKEAVEFYGKIDILVNSAGLHCRDEFGNVSIAEWDRVMNVNLRGVYFMTQTVANYMIKNKIKGHILNVGSASSVKPGWTPYEISKCAVRSMTLGFAHKLISHGIVVNSIAPGPVATEMLGRGEGDNLSWPGNPTGRMATAEEVANLSVTMVSDLGDLIVGDTYFISGGSGTICLDK